MPAARHEVWSDRNERFEMLFACFLITGRPLPMVTLLVLPFASQALSSVMHALLQHIAQFTTLSPPLAEALRERAKHHYFDKGELLHPADTMCQRTYWIEQGLVRIYFNKDGKIVTDGFAAENEWMTSAYSFMRGVPDSYAIAAIEPTVAYSLSLEDLLKLFGQFHEMERFGRMMMSAQFIQQSERLHSLRFTSPAEKYQHFCTHYRPILARLPLGMVASYLGITPETLSRVRAKAARGAAAT
jgi:CRP-like cAMP-binding protein